MIYEHLGYRSYLKEILAEKIARHPRYSLRAMAKQLGFAASSLSEVLAGKSGFSLLSARKIASRLGLSAEETEYFCLLVQLESAADVEVRGSLLERLKSLRPQRTVVHDLSVDRFKQISEWYHSAILEMVELDGAACTPASVARRLGISKIEAEVAIERLLRLELLEKDPKGGLVRVHDHLVTRSDAMRDQALRKFFGQMMQKAAEALETQSSKERLSGYETFPMSAEAMPEAREIVERFFTEMIALSKRMSRKSDVYHLNLHFFNLTQRKD